MNSGILTHFDRRAQARGARREVEEVLDRSGWSWSPRLSFLIDMLTTIEESA